MERLIVIINHTEERPRGTLVIGTVEKAINPEIKESFKIMTYHKIEAQTLEVDSGYSMSFNSYASKLLPKREEDIDPTPLFFLNKAIFTTKKIDMEDLNKQSKMFKEFFK